MLILNRITFLSINVTVADIANLITAIIFTRNSFINVLYILSFVTCRKRSIKTRISIRDKEKYPRRNVQYQKASLNVLLWNLSLVANMINRAGRTRFDRLPVPRSDGLISRMSWIFFITAIVNIYTSFLACHSLLYLRN